MMNVMAREGYDVWTMDHDGYGYSGSSGNNSDIASGVEDLKAAMLVLAEGDRPDPDAHVRHFVGRHPRRSLRAGAAGQRRPAVALSAFTYKGTGAEEIARRREAHRRIPRQPRDGSATN